MLRSKGGVSHMNVTVVIAMHNMEDFITETVSSISSSASNLRLLIVDDGSSDQSVAVARSAIRRTAVNGEVIELKNNEGPSKARNTGLELCNTPFIAFLDADDLLCSRTLDWATSQLNHFPEVDVVVASGTSFLDGNWTYLPFNDRAIRNYHLAGKPLTTCSTRSPWLAMLEPSPATHLYRVQFLRQHNIRFPIGLRFEDFGHHWLSMALARQIVVLPETQVLARQGRFGQMTASRTRERFDVLRVWDEALSRLLDLGVDPEFGKHTTWSGLRASTWCGENISFEARSEYWAETLRVWRKVPASWRKPVKTLPLSPRERVYYRALEQGKIDFLVALSFQSLDWRFLPSMLSYFRSRNGGA